MSMEQKTKKTIWRRLRHPILMILIIATFFFSTMTTRQEEAQAWCITDFACLVAVDAIATFLVLNFFQEELFQPLLEWNIREYREEHEVWITQSFFDEYVSRVMSEMTGFLDASAMYQMRVLGTFFDARNQMETQRVLFKLQAKAHKDYQPSESFCHFGTNTRSLAAAESRSRLNLIALSEQSLQRQLGYNNAASSESVEDDKTNRWQRFITTYCDPKDNNWTVVGTGLDLACDLDGSGSSAEAGPSVTNAATGNERWRINRDVDYTAVIDEPRTLNVNYTNDEIYTAGGGDVDNRDEQDIRALSENLYGHNVLSRLLSYARIKKYPAARGLLMDLRSVAAKRAVAQHSFNTIVAMKSEGTNGDPVAPEQPDVGLYMASLMRELMPTTLDASGDPIYVPDEEVLAILGRNPSYYAQLEFLSKKLYQNPEFFANLYDKPTNVARKSVAMKAIDLMLDRALFESETRQEMLLSVMLSSELNKKFRTINRDLKRDKRK